MSRTVKDRETRKTLRDRRAARLEALERVCEPDPTWGNPGLESYYNLHGSARQSSRPS
jgi:hypothetical protein